MEGTGEAPTLNHKADYDSKFLDLRKNHGPRGPRNIHAHLEEYWSIRKKTAENGLNIEKGRLS